MDIEDLFNENGHSEEEVKAHPMIIPMFDPCSGEVEEAKASGKKPN
jgi:ABC-type cobalt transport system substrate-binding protein